MLQCRVLGELSCTPSRAHITWYVPVLMQGAEIRELTQGLERGGQPAALRLQALSSGSPALSLPGRCQAQLSSLPTMHRKALNPRAPQPIPTVSCSRPNALRSRAVDLRGRALEVDVGASQGPCPKQDQQGLGLGQQGKPRGNRVLCEYLLIGRGRTSVLTTVKSSVRRGRPVA